MKIQVIAFAIGILIANFLFGQNITGQWNGILKVQGTQLRIVFNIRSACKRYPGDFN